MQFFQPEFNKRTSLLALLAALDASTRALGRDDCGDWRISGKSGQIYPDGNGYLIMVVTDESARRWTNIKQRLPFCRVTQDGDDEGALHLDRLPAPHEAAIIREATGIRKKKMIVASDYVTVHMVFTGHSADPDLIQPRPGSVLTSLTRQPDAARRA